VYYLGRWKGFVFICFYVSTILGGGRKYVVILICLLFGNIRPIPFRFYTGPTDKTGYAMLAAAIILMLEEKGIHVTSFNFDGLPCQNAALKEDDPEGYTKYLMDPDLLTEFFSFLN
jgi:hypothetical protein